jgi:1,4-dihydroxy-2-naphthoate octaprenyltransferase
VLFGKGFGRQFIAISCLFASIIPIINALVLHSLLPILAIMPTVICWAKIKTILANPSKESLYPLLKKTGLNVFLYGILVSLGFFLN